MWIAMKGKLDYLSNKKSNPDYDPEIAKRWLDKKSDQIQTLTEFAREWDIPAVGFDAKKRIDRQLIKRYQAQARPNSK